MLEAMEANIRFVGHEFHLVAWNDLMRHLELRVVGGIPQKAYFTSNGNNIVGEDCGFSTIEFVQGFEWRFILKHSRDHEGVIKLFAILLAAFAVPQPVVVTIREYVFNTHSDLLTYASQYVTTEFSMNDLIQSHAYREGDGVQFL